MGNIFDRIAAEDAAKKDHHYTNIFDRIKAQDAAAQVTPEETSQVMPEEASPLDTPPTAADWDTPLQDGQLGAPKSTLGIASEGDLSARDEVNYIRDNFGNIVKPVPAMAYSSAKRGLGGVVKQSGELLSSDALTDYGQGMLDDTALVDKEINKEHPLRENSWAQGIRSGASSTYMHAPFMLAGGAVTSVGKPLLGMATSLLPMGTITEGDAYAKYRDRGFSPEDATVGGSVEGVIEVATESLPTKRVLGALAAPAKKNIGRVLKGFLKLGGEEYVGEHLATLGQDLTDRIMSRPDMTGEEKAKKVNDYFTVINPKTGHTDFYDNMKQTMIATTTQMLLMGTVGVAGNATRKPTNPVPTGRAEEDRIAQIDAETQLMKDELARRAAAEAERRVNQALAVQGDAEFAPSDLVNELPDGVNAIPLDNLNGDTLSPTPKIEHKPVKQLEDNGGAPQLTGGIQVTPGGTAITPEQKGQLVNQKDLTLLEQGANTQEDSNLSKQISNLSKIVVANPDNEVAAANLDKLVKTQDRRNLVQEVKKEERTGGERRAQDLRNVRVSDMSLDDTKAALLQNELTGIPNRRAYAEATDFGKANKSVQIAIDADNLKWVNDNLGHGNGDEMLRQIADALHSELDEAFHVSGDEFIAQGDEIFTMLSQLDKVQEKLNDVTLEMTLDDGTVITKKGLDITYGISETGNLKDADTDLAEQKRIKEASGQRAARQEEPRGVTRTSPEGQVDQVNQGEEVVSWTTKDKEADPRLYDDTLRTSLVDYVNASSIAHQNMGNESQGRLQSGNPTFIQDARLAMGKSGTIEKVRNAVERAAAGETLGRAQRAAVKVVLDHMEELKNQHDNAPVAEDTRPDVPYDEAPVVERTPNVEAEAPKTPEKTEEVATRPAPKTEDRTAPETAPKPAAKPDTTGVNRDTAVHNLINKRRNAMAIVVTDESAKLGNYVLVHDGTKRGKWQAVDANGKVTTPSQYISDRIDRAVDGGQFEDYSPDMEKVTKKPAKSSSKTEKPFVPMFSKRSEPNKGLKTEDIPDTIDVDVSVKTEDGTTADVKMNAKEAHAQLSEEISKLESVLDCVS